MVRFIILLFTISFIQSCSINSKSKLSNEDFNRKKPFKYKKDNDKYEAKIDDKPINTFFINETLSAENKDKIDDINAGKDVILNISKSCHLQKFDDAYAIAKKESDRYLKNPAYWNVLGVCYSMQSKYKMATLYFNKAIALISGYAPAYNNLAVMYKMKGETNKALLAFERALKSNKYSRVIKLNLAETYLEINLPAKSLEYLLELEKLGSDSRIHLAIANTYLQLGDNPKSLSFFEKVVEPMKDSNNFKLNYAVSLFKNNKKDKAEDIFDDIEKNELTGTQKEYYAAVKQMLGVK